MKDNILKHLSFALPNSRCPTQRRLASLLTGVERDGPIVLHFAPSATRSTDACSQSLPATRPRQHFAKPPQVMYTVVVTLTPGCLCRASQQKSLLHRQNGFVCGKKLKACVDFTCPVSSAYPMGRPLGVYRSRTYFAWIMTAWLARTHRCARSPRALLAECAQTYAKHGTCAATLGVRPHSPLLAGARPFGPHHRAVPRRCRHE